jgi:hypothetical protein
MSIYTKDELEIWSRARALYEACYGPGYDVPWSAVSLKLRLVYWDAVDKAVNPSGYGLAPAPKSVRFETLVGVL